MIKPLKSASCLAAVRSLSLVFMCQKARSAIRCIKTEYIDGFKLLIPGQKARSAIRCIKTRTACR